MSSNKFSWDAESAFRKGVSGITLDISTPTPIISIGKSFEVTPPNDPKKDAYRNCSKCGKHYNYHKNGQCP